MQETVRMQLSKKRVEIKNTYEFKNTNQDLILNKINNINSQNNDFYLLIEINNFKLLFDQNDILYLSRFIEINKVSFTHNAIIGYTFFNNLFYTILDLPNLLENNKTHDNLKSGFYLYFFNKQDVIQIPNFKIIKKRGLNPINHNLNIGIGIYIKQVFQDINGNLYHLLDPSKLKPII